MNYIFHPEAELEFVEAVSRYELEVPGLGRQFRDEIRHAIDLIAENPEIGAPVAENLRCFVLRRFPFSVVYGAMPYLVYIVAVAHGRRRPGYWASRVQESD